MKELLKNPIMYYILVPIVVGFWPLLMATVYLPKSKNNWEDMKSQYLEAQITIQEILPLDPERLEFTDSVGKNEQFDYVTAIAKIARDQGIPDTKYDLSSGLTITTREQTTKTATLALNEVDITKLSRFLSTLLLHWPSLECTNIQLVKKKNALDSWDVDLKFKYYF
jgi:hypothetical protein